MCSRSQHSLPGPRQVRVTDRDQAGQLVALRVTGVHPDEELNERVAKYTADGTVAALITQYKNR